jgi:RNA polymerase sigma-70 factor (ECF subfamily)
VPLPPNKSDRDWIAAVRRGDATAFEALFTTYYESLCGFVHSYVRDAAIAEEIVQDIFLHIWKERTTWDPAVSTRQYVFAAARNRALNHLRNTQVFQRAVERSVQEGEPPTLGARPWGADTLLEANELQRAFSNAVALLPERQRLVVTLRWHHQLSHVEIAHILGVSVKGVETQLGRALKTIRERLKTFRP